MLPLISCKTITYGRVSTLEESIHSFLSQDYLGRKELIIVNDYPFQKLICDHPEIKIINSDQPFLTIGEKENFAVSQCSGEIIAVWDDDDIALPNHLTNIAKFFKEDSDLLQWNRGVLFDHGSITAITGLGNAGIAYSKKVWKEIGGHPLENAGYDMTFVLAIHALNRNKVVIASPQNDEVSFFYMWGGRCYHMSGQGTDVPGRSNILERHSSFVEEERKRGNIPTGDIYLHPHWKQNYSKILKAFNGEIN